jgi:hypothetical protein
LKDNPIALASGLAFVLDGIFGRTKIDELHVA